MKPNELEEDLRKASPEGPGTDFALNWLGDVTDMRIVDIGGGEGPLSIFFSLNGAMSICCDVNGERLSAGAGESSRMKAESAAFVCARSEALPFRRNSVDVVFSRSTLQYTCVPEVLDECLRILKPGGALILSENLSGNPFVRIFRKLRRLKGGEMHLGGYCSSGSGEIRSYVSHAWMKELGRRLDHPATHFCYYLHPLTHGLCNITGGSPAAGMLHRAVIRLDRMIGRLPFMQRYAWWGTLCCRKPCEEVECPEKTRASVFRDRAEESFGKGAVQS